MANLVNWFVNNFVWFQAVSVALSVVFLVLIIKIIIKIDYYGDKREYQWEIAKIDKIYQIKSNKIWNSAYSALKQSKPDLWKKIIIEVNDFFDDYLKVIGYLGDSEWERLVQVENNKISNIEKIKKICEEKVFSLYSNPEASLGYEEAKEILREFRQSYRQLGLMDNN